MATATAKNIADTRPTGSDTRMVDRRRLDDGTPNMSPSGELRPVRTPEPDVAPLKAVNQIVYGNDQLALPGSIFVPFSAADRAELLAGDFPAAEELTDAERALFAEQQSEFA